MLYNTEYPEETLFEINGKPNGEPVRVSSQAKSAESADSVRIPPDVLSSLVGECPIINCKVEGVSVTRVMDSGSQVKTISQSFFESQLEVKVEKCNDSSSLLKLKAANGIELPFIGYFEADVVVLGRVIPRRGILVQKDNPGQKARTSVGLLGTNVLTELPEWRQWLLQAKVKSTNSSTHTKDVEGLARVRTTVSIPTRTAMFVPVKGPAGKTHRQVEELNHPLTIHHLILEPLVVGPKERNFNIRLYNLIESDVILKAKTVLGKLSAVEVMEKHYADEDDEPQVNFEVTANGVRVNVGPPHREADGSGVQTSTVSADEDIKEPVWMKNIQRLADLDPTYEQKFVEMLHRRHQAFAKHEDDIGTTTTAKHCG